jgi:hypothetical protein
LLSLIGMSLCANNSLTHCQELPLRYGALLKIELADHGTLD